MPSLLLPIMTGLFLVFTGILLGYFLWFRDRTEEELLQQNLNQENNRLTSELSTLQLRNGELDEHLSKQNGKLQILQELCDDLVSGREANNQERLEMEAELRASRRLLDESKERLNAENQRRCEFEDQLHSIKQQHLNSFGAMETTWREKHASVESQLTHSNAEFKRLSSENERIAERLHQSESKIAELKSTIASKQELLELAKKDANGLEKEYVSLETSMNGQIELLNESRGQAAAAISAKELAEESLSQLRTHSESQRQRIQKLEQLLTEADGIKEKCLTLNHSLENNKRRIVEISAERDMAMNAEKESLAAVTGLRRQNENQELTIRSLREQETRIAEQRLSLEEKLSATESTKKRLEETLELRDKDLNDRGQDWDRKETQLNERIQKLESMLETRDKDLNDRGQGWTRKETELTQRIHKLESTLDKTEADLVNTEKELSEAEQRMLDLEQDHEKIETVSREYQARMSHLVAQRDTALDETKSLHGEVERLRRLSKTNEETIRTLRRERGAVLMSGRKMYVEQPVLVQPPRLYDPEPAKEQSESVAADQEYGGKTRLDPVRGVVYTERPKMVDDLKLISGIAKVLEGKLNDYGIYTYKQIVDWDQKAINEFSQLLVFKDRIERDDWQAQGRRLHERKYLKKAA